MTEAATRQWFADMLRNARKGADLTQQQLSEKTGISQPHISRAEKGTHWPSARTVAKWIGACGFSLPTGP